MKAAIFVTSFAMAFGPAVAMATGCSASTGYAQLSRSQVEALLGTGMACYPVSPGTGNPYTNQEYHSGATNASSGNIVDFKRGAAAGPDQTKQIGSYSISAGGTITYTYTLGGAPAYTIWGDTTKTTTSGLTWDFCTGGTPIQIKVNRTVGGAAVACS